MGGVCGGGGAFKTISVTVVGSPGVGKSALLNRFKENINVNTDVSVSGKEDDGKIDPFCAVIELESNDYSVSLADTHSSADGDMLRSLSYGSANVVIICFAINDQKSFHDIKSFWLPEVKKYVNNDQPVRPVLLCGTKADTRGSATDPNTIISAEEGHQLCKDIDAYGYIECSIETSSSVDAVIRKAADEARKLMYPVQILKSYSSRLL